MNHFLGNKVSLTVMLACLSITAALAQSISGKISDSKKEPVIGAAITVEGSTLGVASDLDGNYKITGLEAKNYVLVISGLGYAKQKKTVDLSTQKDQIIDIELAEDALQLDQVVVVGYGLEQKRDVTGSISTINAKDINNTKPIGASITTQPKIDILPSSVISILNKVKSLANHHAAIEVTIKAKNIQENTFDMNVFTLVPVWV